MVYCLTSCLDFLLLPTLLFEFPVCFILKAPLCVSSHAFHFLSFLVFPPFSLSAPPWLVTPVSWEPFPSKYFPPVCSMAAMLQCGLSKHFLYCLSVPGVFLEFLLCTFLHFAWFWIFGLDLDYFYLCSAGFVCSWTHFLVLTHTCLTNGEWNIDLNLLCLWCLWIYACL